MKLASGNLPVIAAAPHSLIALNGFHPLVFFLSVILRIDKESQEVLGQ